MESVKKIFGMNVKKLRERMEWSQAELAEKVDVSMPFMSHIEHGTRGVSMETIETFALVFGVPYVALFEENLDEKKIKSNVLKLNKLKKRVVASTEKAFAEFLEEL